MVPRQSFRGIDRRPRSGLAVQCAANVEAGFRPRCRCRPRSVPRATASTQAGERYVREWLEQQAVAGFLTVDDGYAEPNARRYALPAAYRPVFVDEEDLNYLTPAATLAIGVLGPMDALIDAYRTGAGVPYEAY